jgi:hypothetical protein
MHTRISVRSLFAILVPLALGACGSTASETPAATAKTSLGQVVAGDLTVELLTTSHLATGLTPVFCRITAAGQPVTDAAVTFLPIMAMSSGMKHSAPVLGQGALDDAHDYATSVVFQMASSDMDTWSGKVTVSRPGKDAVEATFPKLAVEDSGRAKTFSCADAAGGTTSKYVASLNFEAAPKVGLNPAVLTLHRMKDMMTFEEVEGATLEIDPQMPSMGHGSPGSVQPTKTSLGRYAAQVSFSMPGTWETTLTVRSGASTLGTAVFVTTF